MIKYFKSRNVAIDRIGLPTHVTACSLLPSNVQTTPWCVRDSESGRSSAQ